MDSKVPLLCSTCAQQLVVLEAAVGWALLSVPPPDVCCRLMSNFQILILHWRHSRHRLHRHRLQHLRSSASEHPAAFRCRTPLFLLRRCRPRFAAGHRRVIPRALLIPQIHRCRPISAVWKLAPTLNAREACARRGAAARCWTGTGNGMITWIFWYSPYRPKEFPFSASLH